MSSDERLALRAAQGDRRAFEEIYEHYHQHLYRFCLAMVGNPQDAQDTLQNTMVKVLRSLPGEKREIRLKPWLYKIARNESVETLRKRRDHTELEAQQASAVDVVEAAETRERLRILLADLEQLPERQRAVLVMRELSGLDFDQIGGVFGTSPAVARQTLYEARLSLRQLEAGREMRCAEVMRELSDADGRVTRRREIRAHLRGCADCRAFRDEIAKRHEDLAALAPLPVAASAGLLHSVLGAKASATAGAAATSALVKSAATVAVVAVVGVSAADRSGIVDLPLPGGGHDSQARDSLDAGDPGSAAGAASTPGPVTGGENGGASQGKHSKKPDEGGTARSGETAAERGSSPSQAGESPPGGGYGRSAADQRGRPDGLPAASDKGQQTAAEHKSEHAASPPGRSGAPPGKEGTAASKPAAPPAKAKGPPAEPSADAPSRAGGHGPSAPPGLEG